MGCFFGITRKGGGLLFLGRGWLNPPCPPLERGVACRGEGEGINGEMFLGGKMTKTALFLGGKMTKTTLFLGGKMTKK